MELEFDHIIVCYGPIVALLRLLAYTLPVALLWRVLSKPRAPAEVVLQATSASLLPYLLCSLAGTWQLTVFIRGLRMTANPFEPLIRAGLTGSLSLAHSGLPGTCVLLFVSVVSLFRRRNVSPSRAARFAVPSMGALATLALLVLAPVALLSFPPDRLLATSLVQHHLGCNDTLRLAIALMVLLVLGVLSAATMALTSAAVTARPSNGRSITAFVLAVSLLLVSSWLFAGLPQHNEQPPPSGLRNTPSASASAPNHACSGLRYARR